MLCVFLHFFRSVMKKWLGEWSQFETAKYFEWIIKCILCNLKVAADNTENRSSSFDNETLRYLIYRYQNSYFVFIWQKFNCHSFQTTSVRRLGNLELLQRATPYSVQPNCNFTDILSCFFFFIAANCWHWCWGQSSLLDYQGNRVFGSLRVILLVDFIEY